MTQNGAGSVPKITGGVTAAIAVLLALTLTGCGDDDTVSTGDAAARGFAGTTDTSSPTPSASENGEPLTARTAVPSDTDDTATYIEYVRGKLLANTQIPDASDDQLVDAGWRACELLDSGTNPDDLTVIDGEERAGGDTGYFQDSATIATGARMFLCVP